jgi:uncharacterized protein YcnI
VIRPRHLRFPLTAAATAAALCVAGPVAAHVHTDPSAVQAGKEATVGFTIEHGCDGSPTTKMEIQLPDGSSGISGVDADGFTSAVAGQVVTFTGGEVADGTEASFQVTFTAPDEAGEVPVKVIQSCAEGVNEWIEVAAEGEAEPESPAPLLTITSGAPSESDAEHSHDDEQGHDEKASSTTIAITPIANEEADDAGDDDSSSAPLVFGGIAAIAILGGGGALYARSKAQRTDD